jgi:hypothetical protein
MEVHKKLSHLTREQIDTLISRYEAGEEKVIDLISEYKIDAKAGQLLSLLPPIIHETSFCPYCPENNLISKREGRTGYSWRSSANQAYCPECNHRNHEYCCCQNCEEIREIERIEQEQRRSRVVEECYDREHHVPPPENLTLEDAVYLLSLARHSLSEDLEQVFPYDDSEIPYAPLYEFQNQIVKHLYTKDFLCIGVDSKIEAFEFNEDETDIDAYYPKEVIWEFLPGLSIEDKRLYLKKVEDIANADKWPTGWSDQISEMWHQIAKYECIEYFLFLLDQRNFRIDKIGEKTHATFENLLNDFPVSRIYNLSWQAVRDTTDYIVREGLPKWHGKNMFVGAIQRKADKAKAQGWELNHSRRDYNVPQTALSSTFFNVFLSLGDKAFETLPPKDSSEEALAS